MIVYAIIVPVFIVAIMIVAIHCYTQLMDRVLQHEFMTSERFNEIHNMLHDKMFENGCIIENPLSIKEPNSESPVLGVYEELRASYWDVDLEK